MSDAVHSVPITLVAPARPEPGHDPERAARFHAERLSVAAGAAISVRQDPEKHHRRGYRAKDEQSPEQRDEQGDVRHRSKTRLYRSPGLDVRHVTVLRVDHDFRSDRNRLAIEAARLDGMVVAIERVLDPARSR